MPEMDGDFFGRQKKCVGAGISGGDPRGVHEAGGHALHPRGHMVGPPGVFSVPIILKYSGKIIFHFQGIWRTFIFGVFFIARIIQKTDKKNTIFTLFIRNNRK